MNNGNEFVDSKLKLDWEDPFKWSNTYHFLFVEENKKRLNFSENETLFHLEIKNHNIIK